MKRLLSLTFCAVFIIFLLTCCDFMRSSSPDDVIVGVGSKEIFTFNVGEINEVHIGLLCNIIYNSSPSDIVTFEVQPNLMEHVTIEESDGILIIRANRRIHPSSLANTPVLTLSTPVLNRVYHTGAGHFSTNDPITGEGFVLDFIGSAEGRLELDVYNLTVILTGAGNLELYGNADTADVNVHGAGKLDALELHTRTTSINIAGTGIVRISCSDELTVNAVGAGLVEYRGFPTIDVPQDSPVIIRQVD